MKGLPRGSALTAIFDSCTSGTLLGNVSSTHTTHPLLLIPRKTSSTTSATTCTGLGSTREVVGATLFETTSVCRHHVPSTCCCPSSYLLVQLGETAKARRLHLPVDPAPSIGGAASRSTSTSPASSKSSWTPLRTLCRRLQPRTQISTPDRGPRLQNASLYATGGVVRSRCRQPLNMVMWCVGVSTHPSIPR